MPRMPARAGWEDGADGREPEPVRRPRRRTPTRRTSWSSAAASAGSSRRWSARRSGCGSRCWRHPIASAGWSDRRDVAGLTVDVGAESFATRGGHVRALVEELGLGDDIVTPKPGGAWLAGLPGAAPRRCRRAGCSASPRTRSPKTSAGSSAGAARGAPTSTGCGPSLTIGKERSLGRLVRTRMGDLVLDRLVAPVTSGVYSADPDDIDVELAAPGLNAALTRTGSLSGAVALLRGGRTDGARAARSRASPAGCRGSSTRSRRGWPNSAPRSAWRRPVEIGRARRRRPTRAAAGRRGWTVRTADEDLHADQVVVAASESAARRLLAALIGAGRRRSPRPARARRHARARRPGARRRAARLGSAHGARAATAAKALTHATAKWAWLRDAATAQHPHRHVVRVSFGSQSEPPATEGLDLDARDRRSRSPRRPRCWASRSTRGQVVGSDIARYEQTLPGAAIGQRDAAAAVRARLDGRARHRRRRRVAERHRARAGRPRRARAGGDRSAATALFGAPPACGLTSDGAGYQHPRQPLCQGWMPESAYGSTLGPDHQLNEREETP